MDAETRRELNRRRYPAEVNRAKRKARRHDKAMLCGECGGCPHFDSKTVECWTFEQCPVVKARNR
jgi:hypothetical protein